MSFDREKIIESIFDPNISEILAELEDGEKQSSYLSEKLKISEEEIQKRVSYLSKHGFVKEEKKEGKIIYSADADKLEKVIENDNNFKNVVDGLTEMDSYLN